MQFLSSLMLLSEKMKPEDEEWTIKNFQKLLKKHVNALEASDIHSNEAIPETRWTLKIFKRIKRTILEPL